MSEDSSTPWNAGSWERPPSARPASWWHLLFPALIGAIGLTYLERPRIGLPDERDLQRTDGYLASAGADVGGPAQIRLQGNGLLLQVNEKCAGSTPIAAALRRSQGLVTLWVGRETEYVKATGEAYREVFAINRGTDTILSYAHCEASWIAGNTFSAYVIFGFASFVALLWGFRIRRSRARWRSDPR